MAIWKKQGVFGPLSREAGNALRRLARLFAQHGKDLYITSQREGTHSPGSLHPQGDAFDCRKATLDIDEIRHCLGNDYDCVEESHHYHIEYDPKLSGEV